MSPNNLTAPLTFEPIFRERMWGGRRLESAFQKKLPPQKRIGESWEIVDRAEAQSVVGNGPLRGRTLHELWTRHREQIFGEVPDTPRFPLLIKVIDAQERLSLQVHPAEDAARRLGGEPKSEFWYVAGAEETELFLGFRKPITRKKFEEAVREGKVLDYVHKVAVHEGDAVFIPAGRVHAADAGNLLIEIQQNSDTTYRIFDWNRIDPVNGKRRELHVEPAMQSINFEDLRPKLIEARGELLLSHSLFEIRKWNLHEDRDAAPPGQFAIVCCLTGNLSCANVEFAAGQIFLVPAHLQNRRLKPGARETSVLRVAISTLK
jgi:mannose-6-phosphate isomerase